MTHEEPQRNGFVGMAADLDSHQEEVWQRVELARHPLRPHALELIRMMGTNVREIHGDRLFGDDAAIVAGFATIDDLPVVFVGNQKGTEDINERIRRNFGMAHAEGYRKAIRAFELAEKFGLPVVTLVDTPGAAPDEDAEERGVAEAIARSISAMTRLRTPIVSVIIGEGGSGGALAIAVGDRVLALENSIYSVISPEGCAEILWRTKEARKQAALAMKLTAQDQERFGVVDKIIMEPEGGAHEDTHLTADRLRTEILKELGELMDIDLDLLVDDRYKRYRKMGVFKVSEPPKKTIEPHHDHHRVSDVLHRIRHPHSGDHH